MQYVDVVTDDSILVLNTSTGDQVKFYTDDARYEKALKLLVVRDYDAIFKLEKNSKIAYYNIQSKEYFWKEEGY